MQTVREKIQASGLKATPQRIAIYNVMESIGHACADMVAERLKDNFPSLTVATIYNVLDSFVTSGLLSKRFSSNNKMYFDVNTHSHMHIYDGSNNSYTDYEDPDLIEMITNHIRSKNSNIEFSKLDIQLIK